MLISPTNSLVVSCGSDDRRTEEEEVLIVALRRLRPRVSLLSVSLIIERRGSCEALWQVQSRSIRTESLAPGALITGAARLSEAPGD